MVTESVYQCPIGPLGLIASEDGIISLRFLFGQHGSTLEQVSTQDASHFTKDKKAEMHLSICIRWLDAYFNGTLLKLQPPPPKPDIVLPQNGKFFSTVWTVLLNTDIGDTLSYKELATLSGSPQAARAVGQAVKKHSIPILVPCHRVLHSGNRQSAGSYSGGDGTATKEWLLKHENKMKLDSHTQLD